MCKRIFSAIIIGGLLSWLTAADETKLTYPVVGTNQQKCYDAKGKVITPAANSDFYGQDAQFPGLKPSYTDNGDGTITDNHTNLMWQKQFRVIGWHNAADDARRDRTGGYSDWRVPTVKELYSLIEFSGQTGSAKPDSATAPPDAIPYLDTHFFAFEYPKNARFIDAQYISSTVNVTPVMGNQAGFFGVNFADGRIKCYPQSGNPRKPTFYARYVRGNSGYGVNHLINNGDGTVSDRATGLMWMKADSGDPALKTTLKNYAKKDGSLDWREALDWSNKLNYANHDDWRLPNAKELQTIVDYTRSPDKTHSPAIAPVFECTKIKNEGGIDDYPCYWTGTTHLDGRESGANAVYVAFGRALGYMTPRDNPQGEKRLLDVHGAGAQRSDPKVGNPADFPQGAGPQGDVRRIYNFVRCVRSEAVK